MADDSLHHETLEAMERYGGSFVVALAGAWRHADAGNMLELMCAFGDYYQTYQAMALEERRRRQHGGRPCPKPTTN